jgi:hypothetical protein
MTTSLDPSLFTPNTLLIFCDGGFANRVNCLLDGLVLAAKLQLSHKILWPRNNRCGAAFNQIFSNDDAVHEVRLQDLVPHQKLLQLWLHENDVGFTDPVAPLRQRNGLQAAAVLRHGDERTILFCENMVLPWLPADDVQRALKRLQFRPEITGRAKELIATHTSGSFVGIHLRATDFTSSPPTSAMLAVVQAQTDARFFVCSDDASLEARFAQFPNVFVHEKTAYVEKRADGPWRGALGSVTDSDGLPYTSNIERGAQSVVEACVDLLLLAASNPMRTSGSSFLALAERLKQANVVNSPDSAPAPAPAPAPTQPESPMDPFTSQQEIIEVLNLLRPYHMVNDHKVRIGGDADGGYVMPSLALKSNAVVSIGIGDQVSFDAELADRGATVLQFDHTIPGAPKEHANFRFHRQGWGPKDEGELLSLNSMMRGLDWTQAKFPILKFDTEGAEWASLTAASSEDLGRFAVIAGEFHGFHNLVSRPVHDVIRAVFEKIRQTHLPVHLHANNATGIRLVLGVPVPPLLEITFVRKDVAVFAGHSNEPIPGPLDRPNMADRPDICLRPF